MEGRRGGKYQEPKASMPLALTIKLPIKHAKGMSLRFLIDDASFLLRDYLVWDWGLDWGWEELTKSGVSSRERWAATRVMRVRIPIHIGVEWRMSPSPTRGLTTAPNT